MNATAVLNTLHKIEAELRRLGLLIGDVQPALIVKSAFGMGEMAFEDWLATVFLPRAYEAAQENRWPAGSQVGIAAIRNFDGRYEYDPLVDLLCQFDQTVIACINSQKPSSGAPQSS